VMDDVVEDTSADEVAEDVSAGNGMHEDEDEEIEDLEAAFT
jgi:hypothetical protein